MYSIEDKRVGFINFVVPKDHILFSEEKSCEP